MTEGSADGLATNNDGPAGVRSGRVSRRGGTDRGTGDMGGTRRKSRADLYVGVPVSHEARSPALVGDAVRPADATCRLFAYFRLAQALDDLLLSEYAGLHLITLSLRRFYSINRFSLLGACHRGRRERDVIPTRTWARPRCGAGARSIARGKA